MLPTHRRAAGRHQRRFRRRGQAARSRPAATPAKRAAARASYPAPPPMRTVARDDRPLTSARGLSWRIRVSLQPATGGTDSANANLINPRTNKNRNNDRSSPTSPFARSTDNRSHSRSRTPPICYANGFGDVSSGHRWLTHGYPYSSLVDPRCRARSARGWRASCWVPTMVAPSNRLCIPGAARAAATGPSAVLGFSTPPRSRVHHGTTATSSTAANSDPAWRPMASPVLPSIHRADPPVTRFRSTCHILNRRYKLRFTSKPI